MNSTEAPSLYIFLGFVLALFIYAITPISDGVTANDWRAAEQACSNVEGGVVKVNRPSFVTGRFEILCKDGRTIYLTEDARR